MRTFNDIKAGDTIYRMLIGSSKLKKIKVLSVTKLDCGLVGIQLDDNVNSKAVISGSYSSYYMDPFIFMILDHEHQKNNSKLTWNTANSGDKIYRMILEESSYQIRTEWICIDKIGYINETLTLIILSKDNKIFRLNCSDINSSALVFVNVHDQCSYGLSRSDAESALVEILKRKLAEKLKQIDSLEKSAIKLESYIDKYGKDKAV